MEENSIFLFCHLHLGDISDSISNVLLKVRESLTSNENVKSAQNSLKSINAFPFYLNGANSIKS